MRSLLVLFLLANSLSLFAQTKAGFTLDELLLKRYDSKKKYPATVLRNEPDAFPDLIPVKIYQGKALYTGKIIDEKGTLQIEADATEGFITHLYSWDSESTRRQVFHVTTNGTYVWYATDTVYFDNQLFTTAVYYQNAEGNVMMNERVYGYDNTVTETSYRIGTKAGDEIEFYEPLKDGLLRTFHNGSLMSYETYVDGYIDGMVVYYAKSQAILQSYFVNAVTGLYGTYYEYDTVLNIVTVGHYTDMGVETGQWISKYTDSSLAAIHWISETGNPDSSKVWDRKGNLQQVNYNYWRSSKTPGVNDYIHYEKSWNTTGMTRSYTNYNAGPNDTIQCYYDVTGLLNSVDRNMNGRIQTKRWHNNGKPASERYGVHSGITGVTLRDSVYREWNFEGTLQKERYYEKGVFKYSTDSIAREYHRDGPVGVGYYITVTQKTNAYAWDTCSIVPHTVIDSVCLTFDKTSWIAHDLKPEAVACFWKISEMHNSGSYSHPAFKYTVLLAKQQSVKLDSSGKIVTKNIALNQFLDSLHLLGLGVVPLGHYEKKKGGPASDYQVTTTDVNAYLNLFYVNRRLQQLAPGSSISMYSQPSATLPAEVIYIPQGEKTPTGNTPVTIIAVANAGSARELKVGAKTIQWDNRPFYVFHVYGDGEIEFARTTYKDTILLQHRGERTGVYAIQR